MREEEVSEQRLQRRVGRPKALMARLQQGVQARLGLEAGLGG